MLRRNSGVSRSEHDSHFRDENGEKHSIGDRSRAEIRTHCNGCASLKEAANPSSLQALEASSAASGPAPTFPTGFRYELGILKSSADVPQVAVYAVGAAVLGGLAAGTITCFGTDTCNQTGKTAVLAIPLGVGGSALLLLLLSGARLGD